MLHWRPVIMSRGGLVIAFCSQVGHEQVVHNVVAEECGSTITSADCFEEDASCPCKRPALQIQMYRPRGIYYSCIQSVFLRQKKRILHRGTAKGCFLRAYTHGSALDLNPGQLLNGQLLNGHVH